VKKSASPILITGILLQKIAPEHSCYVINFYKCFSFGYHQSYVYCALLVLRLNALWFALNDITSSTIDCFVILVSCFLTPCVQTAFIFVDDAGKNNHF